MTDKPIPIDLVPYAEMLGDSREFLRVWAKHGGTLSFVNPRPLGADPALFGIAMVDVIRNAASTYAKATGVSEDEALDRIWMGLDAERSAPTEDDALPPAVVVARKKDD
jgi:hypothetical protein